jgi:hypothetical protein
VWEGTADGRARAHLGLAGRRLRGERAEAVGRQGFGVITVPNRNGTSLGRYLKGVFCLEGEWTGDLKHSSSLEPILQLLRNRDTRFS